MNTTTNPYLIPPKQMCYFQSLNFNKVSSAFLSWHLSYTPPCILHSYLWIYFFPFLRGIVSFFGLGTMFYFLFLPLLFEGCTQCSPYSRNSTTGKLMELININWTLSTWWNKNISFISGSSYVPDCVNPLTKITINEEGRSETTKNKKAK